MRTKLILLAGLVVVLAVGLVGAAYAYDHSKRNVIAQGIMPHRKFPQRAG